MKEGTKTIIIIDNYADITVLDMVSKINHPVTLITKKNGNLKQIDIDKYHKQYTNLEVIYNDTFHDRYLILDNQIIYHNTQVVTVKVAMFHTLQYLRLIIHIT